MAKWYSVEALAEDRTEIRVYGNIVGGYAEYEEVSPTDFLETLEGIESKSIDLRVNSEGGNFFAANLMYQSLLRHPAKVRAYVDNVAASAATHLIMAADPGELYIADTGSIMVHNPWVAFGVAGNRKDIAESARVADNMLSAAEQNMRTAIMTRWKGDESSLVNAMEDETWYPADKAIAVGLADKKFRGMAVAACVPQGLYRNTPEIYLLKEHPMKNGVVESKAPGEIDVTNVESGEQTKPVEAKAAETKPTPVAPVVEQKVDEEIIHARFREKETKRRGSIKALFSKFPDQSDVMSQCLDDLTISPEKASNMLLDALGNSAAPANTNAHIVTTRDARDKFREGVSAGLLMRLGPQYVDPKAEAGSEYRALSLVDVCREVLRINNVEMKGMSRSRIVEAAFTESTGDIPILLENTMHKMLQSAYELAPTTWRRFCRAGSVSDFRVHNRLRLGSITDLKLVDENGEFKQAPFNDAEKETIQATTKGLIVSISRQMFINDDLDGLSRTISMMGQSAARTVDKDVFALFALNSGMGPTMRDGNPLWDAAHNNLGTSGTVSVASFENARVVMALQTDPDGNDYLDLMPYVWVGPTAIGGEAKVVNNADYDIDRSSKYAPPNKSRGLFTDIVDTPRLSGAPWYAFANPAVAPVFEVVFLDGVQTPFLDQQMGWTVDGTSYKVRLDYGVGATDFRGTVRNAGT